MLKKLSTLCSHAFVALALVTSSWSVAGTFTVATRDELLQVTSKIQASQFLTHATFGPTEAEIDALALRMRQIGTLYAASEWLDRQSNPTASGHPGKSLHEAKAEAFIAQDLAECRITNKLGVPITPLLPPAANGAASYVPEVYRYRDDAWWHNAVAAPDQLRQKIAWTLAQIMVVSTVNGDFNNPELEGAGVGPNGSTRKPQFLGISNFYDIFVENAFGSYRDILQKVTYHAVMGDWLSFRGNSKAVPSENRYPDENYAREVMQLFTIGLYRLNDDGTHVQDSQGVSIPTYTNTDIREYAKVFTGLGYNGSGGSYLSAGDNSGFAGTARFTFPMTMAKSQHELAAKSLLHGTLIALPSNATRAQCSADISSALDGLFGHQSCPPFVCNLLIQRLVKSNPSRAYLNRVTSVFKNNGATPPVRGDLNAVIRAILLDPEAWSPIRTQYLRNPNRIVVTTMGSEDSRLQEPVVNFTRMLRGLKARAVYERGTTVLNAERNGVDTTYETVPLSTDFRLRTRNWEFDQNPYSAPSVFNFYLPTFQPAGDIANFAPSTRNPIGKLVAPEFQIVNGITTARTANFFQYVIVWGPLYESGLWEGYFDPGSPNANPPVPPSAKNSTSLYQGEDVTTMLHSTRCRVFLDDSNGYPSIGTFAAMASTMPQQVGGAAKLVERLDLLFCQGTLNESYRRKLVQVLDVQRAEAGATVDQDEALDLARAAVMSVIDSPSFLVSK